MGAAPSDSVSTRQEGTGYKVGKRTGDIFSIANDGKLAEHMVSEVLVRFCMVFHSVLDHSIRCVVLGDGKGEMSSLTEILPPTRTPGNC